MSLQIDFVDRKAQVPVIRLSHVNVRTRVLFPICCCSHHTKTVNEVDTQPVHRLITACIEVNGCLVNSAVTRPVLSLWSGLAIRYSMS